MIEQKEINKIKEITEDFFKKMTIVISNLEVGLSFKENNSEDAKNSTEGIRDVVDLDVKIEEPQILIGQNGQTLFEIQRLLKNILNKKLGKIFYLNLDINEYKKKKNDYLKSIAKDLADQVALIKQEKALPPMSSYERRVVHAELSKRADVATESQGEGFERHIVIKPK